MTPQQRLIVGALLFLLLLVVLTCVRRKLLSVTQGLLWSGLLLGAASILAVPGWLELVTRLTGAVLPVSALTLLSLLILTVFLFYFSLVTHRLNRRHIDLARAVALMEHRMKQEKNEY